VVLNLLIINDVCLQAAGEGADAVFSDQMRLDINHDSGPANGNYLFGDLTKDSGVGRSPRTPGSASDPRSLGESSVPPAWLQDVSERSFHQCNTHYGNL